MREVLSAAQQIQRLRWRANRSRRSRTETAVPDDHRRHALADLRQTLGRREHVVVVVCVDVDEPRRNDSVGCVEAHPGRERREFPNRRNPFAAQADVGVVPCLPRSIDHDAVLQDDVKCKAAAHVASCSPDASRSIGANVSSRDVLVRA